MATTKITTPELFDFSATNTALQLPTGTTAQRPTSPSAGEWRFNTTEKYVEYWDGGAWKQIDTEEPPNPADFPSQNFNVNTYFGNGATQAIDAKFNEAANFNGSSSAIIIQDGGIGNNGTARVSFSVSIWVNTEATSASAIISDYDGVDYSFYLQMNANGTLNIGNYMDGVGSFTSGTATINDGNWHNLVLINNTSDNTQKLFVDGNSTPDINHTLTSGTKNAVAIQVGYYATGGNFLKGKLDQIRFFNAPIIASDITALYSNETTTTAATLNFPAGAGCVAAYQLDGDASDVGGTYGGVTTDIGYTGLRFQPDMIWIKERSNPAQHALFDSVRGNQYLLSPNQAIAEIDQSANPALESFDTNGFTVDQTNTDNYYVNRSSQTYVAWCFNAGGAAVSNTSGSITSSVSANVAAGFSIVKWVGTGASATVGHGLSSTPELIIAKNLDTAGGSGTYDGWPVYASAIGNDHLLTLNSSAQKASTGGTWGSTTPTSTVFTVQDNNDNNKSGDNIIAYCFADIAGYQKVGSYTGSNSTSGPIVYTTDDGTATGTGGFEPAFLLIKGTQSTTQWLMIDNKRSTSNPRNKALFANLADAEGTNNSIDFFTNGFQPITTDGDSNRAENYIYLAIAADKDTSVPTLANSFSPTIYTGDGASSRTITTSIDNDFVWIKKRGPSTGNHLLQNTVQGAGTSSSLSSNSSTAAGNFDQYGYISAFTTNGVTIQAGSSGSYPNDNANENNSTYVAWAWKAGGLPTINSDGDITSIVSANQAAGFSIVKYIGNEQASQTVGHGLGNSPDIAFIKQLDGGRDWIVPLFTETSGDYMELNDTANKATDTNKWSAISTDTFTVGADPYTNGVGSPYIAYCFRSVSGYQKIGSYSSDGNNKTITTGFRPRWVMIKNYSSAGNYWLILDSSRTTGTNGKNRIYANTAQAEDTSIDVSFNATDFTLLTSNGDVNGSGKSYIYLAIA